MKVLCTRIANFKYVWFAPLLNAALQKAVEKFGFLNYWKFAGVVYLTNSMYVSFAQLSRTVSG